MKPMQFKLLLMSLVAVSPLGQAADSPVKFIAHHIGHVRSEAVGVGDFNGDGKLDIVAGPNIYLAPDWKVVKIRTLSGSVDENGKGYVDDFMNLPLDVNGDGRLDVVSCGWFCKCVRWYAQPVEQAGDWTEHVVDTNANYEAGEFCDIDGDGKAKEILAHCQATVWYEVGKLPSGERGLVKHIISEKLMNFGGGVGDLNGDGRPDVLRTEAWFEAPADPRNGKWIEHPWNLVMKDGKPDHVPQMIVYDVNKDKLPDVITSSAHNHGIYWYEQVHKGAFVTWMPHLIDESWSQAHTLALADINGDGTPDLITGKRFMAHNGSDPDEIGKLGVYWYELKRGKNPTWTKHEISFDQGIGSGVELCAVDLDKDGDIDVVVTGKWGGPVWFENKRK